MSISKLKRKILFFIGVLSLSACANNSLIMQFTDDKRYDLAIKLEAKKEYRNALTQLQILQLIYSHPNQIKAHIARIESKISDSITALNKELTQLNEDDKKLVYLKILSLDPNNQLALSALQKLSRVPAIDHEKQQQNFAKIETIINIDAEKKLKQQKTFSDQVLALIEDDQHDKIVTLTDQFLLEHPENEQALRFQFNALTTLAELQLASNNYDQGIEYFEQALSVNGMNSPNTEARLQSVKQELSNDFYNKGMKLFSTNLPKSIQMFRKSVEYDGENAQAIRKLKQAKKIQSNLQKIKAQSQQ